MKRKQNKEFILARLTAWAKAAEVFCIRYHVGYIIITAFVLWLVMFPEFSITADNCRIVDENGVVIEVDMTDRELAVAVLEADSDEIVFKSSIAEWIKGWSEEVHERDGKN